MTPATLAQSDALVTRLADEALAMLFDRARNGVAELHAGGNPSAEAVALTVETTVRKVVYRLGELAQDDMRDRITRDEDAAMRLLRRTKDAMEARAAAVRMPR